MHQIAGFPVLNASFFFWSSQIKKRDPSFAPHSLLDFGSGLATVAWWAWKHQCRKKTTGAFRRKKKKCLSSPCRASHSCWGETLREMVCVDRSGPMNVLAERLLKGQKNRSVSFASAFLRNWHHCNSALSCLFSLIGDEERAEPHIKQVYFRQFLPVSPKVRLISKNDYDVLHLHCKMSICWSLYLVICFCVQIKHNLFLLFF